MIRMRWCTLFCAQLMVICFSTACEDSHSNNPTTDPTTVMPDIQVADMTQVDRQDRMIQTTTDMMSDQEVTIDAQLDMQAGTEVPLIPSEYPLEGDYKPGVNSFQSNLDETRVRVGWVNQTEDALQGINTNCRVGCLRIENDLVRFCIQGRSNFSQFAYGGGNIIDAQRVSEPLIDHLSEILIAPSLGEMIIEEIGIIRDGSEGELAPAVIQVKGYSSASRLLIAYLPTLLPDPMKIVTEYRLYPHRSEIEVYSWFESDRNVLNVKMYDLVIWSDQAIPYYPLKTGDLAPTQSEYFAAHTPQVSYIWKSLDQESLSFFNVPALPVVPIFLGQVFGPVGSMTLFRRSLSIADGSIAHHEISPMADAIPMRIQAHISDLSDTATTDPTHPLFPAKLYQHQNLYIYSEDNQQPHALMAQVRLNDTGYAEVSLPVGNYYVTLDEWWNGAVTQRVTHTNEADSYTIALSAPAVLDIEIFDQAQTPIPGKVRARSDRWGERIFLVLDQKTMILPVGDWSVDVTRGWHYDAWSQVVTLTSSEVEQKSIILNEVIPFEGWTSGEFHQHSAPSLDSTVIRESRVYSNLAEGVGFMVPSDHDVLTDYPELVREMSLSERIGAPITGLEISPTSGHLGAYGIVYQADHEQGAGGAPPLAESFEVNGETRWQARLTADLVREARERGAEVIQINHPRDSTGYFDTVGYQPDESINMITHEHWTDDFDTIEVYNGSSDFCKMMRDWQGLLAQGKKVTAVGNSDSHGILGKPVGYPRNYLPTSAPSPYAVSQAEIVQALKEGKVSIGGGAFMDLPMGPMWGDQLSGTQHEIRLRIRTAPFNKISRVIALHLGQEIWSQNIEVNHEDIIDFDQTISLTINTDGPLIFFAEGPSLPYVYQGAPTFALSNPLWIDSDANGTIDYATINPPSFSTQFCDAQAPN